MIVFENAIAPVTRHSAVLITVLEEVEGENRRSMRWESHFICTEKDPGTESHGDLVQVHPDGGAEKLEELKELTASFFRDWVEKRMIANGEKGYPNPGEIRRTPDRPFGPITPIRFQKQMMSVASATHSRELKRILAKHGIETPAS